MKSNWLRNHFTIGMILPASLISANVISAVLYNTSMPALGQSRPTFVLCYQPECNQSKYYLGYNRTHAVTLQGQEAKLPQQVDTILLEPRDLSIHRLPNIDEKSLDREDSNFVSSIHRIEKLQVGLLRKSELMNLHTKFTDSSILASVKLFWGDTFTVTSQTLAKGTPVKITIERTISGFGNPVTENAFYRANFITFFNGQPVKELTFGLTKEPGQGQKDQVSGKDKVVHILQAKVGDTFTVESLMEVKDGVKADANSHQMLNGADAVQHRIELAAEQSHEACLQSASGQLNSGKC